MFNSVYWDISGICNAHCPYCCNGKNSISGELHKKLSRFITPDQFINSLDYLLEMEQISPKLTTVNLFNWGEPLLHPDLNMILEYIAEVGYTYNISSNGFREYLFSHKAIQKFGNMTFSLPGFSQDSYNRIHGFDFKTVLRNIENMIKTLLDQGFTGTFTISFHVYRFNVNEIKKAREFFSSLPVIFFPLMAYLNGSSMMFDYCTGRMHPDFCKKIEEELFTEHYINIIKPEKYICPQYDILVLDELCNVVLCCGVDKATDGYSLGNIKEIDFINLRSQRFQSSICEKCRNLNIEYIWHNPNMYLNSIGLE